MKGWRNDDVILFKGVIELGYMVCYSCGGYYQLKPGESSYKYKKCCCGGKLKYYDELELPNSKNENEVGVWIKKIKPQGYKENGEEVLREKIKLSYVLNHLKE